MEKINECVGEFTLAVTFRNIEDQFTWVFAGVYGPNFDRDRKILRDELASMLSWWNLWWCIGGDFNVTRFRSVKSGEACLCPTMVEFTDFYQGMMDLPLFGRSFT